MDFGVYMFATDYSILPHELAKAAEERGFESVWFPEHSHIPRSRRTPYPAGGELPKQYSHTLDLFASMAAAAVVTERIKIASGICLVIERDTIALAKEVASVDHLSGGRVLFGIGGGWNIEEMENHGTDAKTRFRKLREQVAALKRIWTEDEASFSGELVSFEPIWCWPKPVQRPHPPVIYGGFSKHCYRRVVDYCDGWMPIGFSADRVLQGIERLRETAAQVGRDMRTISISVYGSRVDPATLDKYRSAGVDRVIIGLDSEAPEGALSQLDKWARRVL